MASSLKALHEIPTVEALYKANVIKRLKAADTPRFPPNASYNSKIATIRYDITKLKVDCIVNAANESLLGGGGVDGAIHRAAGPKLLAECQELDGCETGDAKITNAYDLPCQKVIHTPGPIWFKVKSQAPQLLRSCYRRSLEQAVGAGMKSIAFSSISTGVYGYPSVQAAQDAMSEIRQWLDAGNDSKLRKIIFCTFLEKDEAAYHENIPYYFPAADSIEDGEKMRDIEAEKGA